MDSLTPAELNAYRQSPWIELRRPFANDGGKCWIARLPWNLHSTADMKGALSRSRWRLCEDGKPVGKPHAPHAAIRAEGGGRFSHWDTCLYFSTPDDSDPNTNGRTYALRPDEALFPAADPPHAAVAAQPGFVPLPGITQCDTVIAIFGSSYSGSTLLNAILGTHSRIFGGGELHWLLGGGGSGVCSICGPQCRFWTAPARARLRLDNLYDEAARLFGRPVVADASKMPEWFEPAFAAYPDRRFVKVLLTKHPVRHVSSFLDKIRHSRLNADTRSIDDILRHLNGFYSTSTEKWRFDFVLKYEDMVADLPGTLTPILRAAGLDWEPAMTEWARHEHHHIGGNIGPRTAIANMLSDNEFGRRKYSRPGVFLDDSFKELLSLEEIQQVLLDPRTRRILDRFGYANGTGAAA